MVGASGQKWRREQDGASGSEIAGYEFGWSFRFGPELHRSEVAGLFRGCRLFVRTGLELHKAGQRWRRFQAEMKGPAAAELPDSEREAAAELSDSEKEAAVNPKEWKNKKGKN